jgi:3-hydroxyisobutyrate dehydrogenase-like beta-hydroxyacid dehydrogenase
VRIGFIGLGVMGTPMAGHLARAGYPLAVFDVDPVAVARVKADHADIAVAASGAAVGAVSDVVFTMLPDGTQVQQAALGVDGLVATMAPGSLLIDTSSAQPWLTVETAGELAAAGIAMIDAPVSGARWGAEQADLVFMVGGDLANVARAQPLLELLGRSVHHVGPLGSGHVMKCINNTITAMTLLATAEGLVLGARAGLDPAAVNAVLNESTGGSWISRVHIADRIITRSFDDPFKLELMLKDIRIALRLAQDLEVALPYAALCERVYDDADRYAGPGQSLSELVRWVEHTAGAIITRGGGAPTSYMISAGGERGPDE